MIAGPVLLTGATGLVGHWLVRTAPPGVEVVGVVHRRLARGLPVVTADLRDGEVTRTIVRQVRPSLIVHAAYAKDRESIVGATQHVADAASEIGTDIVFLSTDAVFSGDGVGQDEDAAPAPVGDYGRWKAAAERIVSDGTRRHAIVRLPLVVSVEPDDHVVERIRSGAVRAEATAWFTDELRQPAGAGDLARAIWRIASLPPDDRAGPWHLPGPEFLSRHDIATRVVDVLGLAPGAVRGEPTPPGCDRPRHLHLRDGRARRAIGWSPTPVLS